MMEDFDTHESGAAGASGSQETKDQLIAVSQAAIQPAPENSWRVIVVKPRVDSFNQEELLGEIKAARSDGKIFIALDLRRNRFLSFPAIRFCVSTAKELANESGGFALLGCSERTKRHFEIYGSLDHIRVIRSEQDLPRLESSGAVMPASETVDV